ncbi:hypothetical protein [Nocardia sp. CA-290969]|uniref:hypothetical protein n=1 Tax=Nocardia sp. CA-290969 TaxID=3239986 RepID=UPI003D90A941
MTEGGYGADGTTVDAVAGQLATRLGAIGETAGEVMRRDVRTAAGGAESIALLVQADAVGAGRIAAATAGEQAVDRGATAQVEQVATGKHSAPDPAASAVPSAVFGAEPAESPQPDTSAVPEESTPAGGAWSRPAAEPIPEQSGDSGPGRVGAGAGDAAVAGGVESVDGGHAGHSPDEAGVPHGAGAAGEVDGGAGHPAVSAAVGGGHSGTSEPEDPPEPAHDAANATEPVASGSVSGPDRPVPGPEPVADAAGKDPVVPGDPAGSPSAGTNTTPMAESLAEAPAGEPAVRQSSAPPGSTPWTPDLAGGGVGAAQGQVPGGTPWNGGAGSSMPYMPGMPGGLGSLTPQERPPRGSAPWSRGRGSTHGGGTVFPRPRTDGPEPAGRG